jgi:hypothetical protein
MVTQGQSFDVCSTQGSGDFMLSENFQDAIFEVAGNFGRNNLRIVLPDNYIPPSIFCIDQWVDSIIVEDYLELLQKLRKKVYLDPPKSYLKYCFDTGQTKKTFVEATEGPKEGVIEGHKLDSEETLDFLAFDMEENACGDESALPLSVEVNKSHYVPAPAEDTVRQPANTTVLLPLLCRLWKPCPRDQRHLCRLGPQSQFFSLSDNLFNTTMLLLLL